MLPRQDKNERPEDEFEKRFSRLNHAISSHSLPTTKEERTNDPLIERRVEEWVKQVSESLDQLRKHRRERLSEPCYDDLSERS